MAEKKKFSLAEQIGAAVDSTSIAAMDAQSVCAERTIENITSEILQLKTDAGNAIIGIGQRLIEAKELLSHGEWLPWLSDQVEFSERTAQDFMRLAREWSNPQTLADLGKAKALKLLLLPPVEREEFMEAHDVPNMSTRELEDAIRERDEAKAEAERLEKERDAALAQAKKDAEYFEKASKDADRYCDEAAKYEREVKRLRTKVNELERAPKEVYRDEAAIQKAADEARKDAEDEIERLRAELAETRNRTSAQPSPGAQPRDVFDMLLAEMEQIANRMYGYLLKAEKSDADAAAYIRHRFIDLTAKLTTYGCHMPEDEEGAP